MGWSDTTRSRFEPEGALTGALGAGLGSAGCQALTQPSYSYERVHLAVSAFAVSPGSRLTAPRGHRVRTRRRGRQPGGVAGVDALAGCRGTARRGRYLGYSPDPALSDRPEALTLWAEIAMRLGAWDEAVMRWAAVRAVAPRFARAYVDGARAFDELGRGDEADALLAIGRQRSAGDIWIASVWAEHPARRENWAEAVRRWTELRSDFPDRADTVVPYARVLTASGEGAAAELEAEAMQFPANDRCSLRTPIWRCSAGLKRRPRDGRSYVAIPRRDRLTPTRRGRSTSSAAAPKQTRCSKGRRRTDDDGIVSVWADHPGRAATAGGGASLGRGAARFPDRAT